MNILKIIKHLSIRKLQLEISKSVMILLEECLISENLELNKFIEDSIKNHINYVTTGPGGDNISQAVELEAQISIFLALKLWWVALINKTTISSIVNEALAFSIPVLLEQNQAQEDFRLEAEFGK